MSELVQKFTKVTLFLFQLCWLCTLLYLANLFDFMLMHFTPQKDALLIHMSLTVWGNVDTDKIPHQTLQVSSHLYVYLDVLVFWQLVVQCAFAEKTLGLLEELRWERSFSTVQLFNRSSSHQSSSESGDLTFTFSVTNLTTNCSLPMYWNKRVTFYTSGTVLEWDCHTLIISFPLVSYISMQFLTVMLVT